MNKELRKILKEFDLIATGFDWWNHKPKPQKAREWLLHALQKAYEAGRKEERERIEQVFKDEVPPHGLSLEDSVWLKRILNKAFH